MDRPEQQRQAAARPLYCTEYERAELIGMIVMQGVIRNEEGFGMVERYAGSGTKTEVSAPIEV